MDVWDWERCVQEFGNCKNASDAHAGSVNMTTEMTASVRFRDASRFWIQFVVVPFVVVFGVLSNSVTMVVLTRRRMRSSTNMYLTALAASDLMYLLLSFTMSWEHYPHIHEEQFYYYWRYKIIGIWLTDATNYTSIWLTVSFTVERYIAVCHPMRGKVFCTESRARVVILTVYILCFLTTCSTPFEWQTTAILTTENKAPGIYLINTNTPLADLFIYKNIFFPFSSFTFIVLPLFLLAIFNSFLIHAVHRSQKQRCKMTQMDQTDHSQSQENRITVTLIAVVILFLVCQSPQAIILILYSLVYTPPSGSTADNISRGLGSIANLLVAINASCNFILYCALSDKYRRTFLVTFLSCWHRAPSQANSLYYNNSVYSSRHASVRGTNNLVRANTRHQTNNNGPQSNEVNFSRQPSLNAHSSRQITLT